jgi:hypothetical protein
MSRTIYVGGLFAGKHPRQDIETCITALSEAGIGYACPFLHPYFDPTQTFYERLDRSTIHRSDAAIFLPGWICSLYSKRESHWAKELHLPCFFPISPADLTEVIVWNSAKYRCTDCGEPAVWIQHTPSSDSFPFCQPHTDRQRSLQPSKFSWSRLPA